MCDPAHLATSLRSSRCLAPACSYIMLLLRKCLRCVEFYSRSVFPPHCYDAFDAVRLCMMQKLDQSTCTDVYAAFRPCADEMKVRSAQVQRKKDEEERRQRMQEAAERAKGR